MDIAFVILAVFLCALVAAFVVLLAYYIRESRRCNGTNIEESVNSIVNDQKSVPRITRYIKDTINNKNVVTHDVTPEPCSSEPFYEIPNTNYSQISENDIRKVIITLEPEKINVQNKNLKQIVVRTISEANLYIKMTHSPAPTQSRETSLNIEQEIPPRYSEIGNSTEVWSDKYMFIFTSFVKLISWISPVCLDHSLNVLFLTIDTFYSLQPFMDNCDCM